MSWILLIAAGRLEVAWAAALPATPAGYVTVEINGAARQIPYF